MKNILKKNYFKAFTLGEVLLSLAIIGTIGALTVPMVIGSANEKAMEAGCKKAFVVYSEAMEMATANDQFRHWEMTDAKSAENYEKIKPYLNITKECIGSVGCWTKDVKALNGGVATNFSNGGYGGPTISFKTSDGMNVTFDIMGESFNVTRATANTVMFAVDVNGDKHPNRLGKDVFIFVMGDNGLQPAGNDISDESSDCKATGLGRDCAAVVMRKIEK